MQLDVVDNTLLICIIRSIFISNCASFNINIVNSYSIILLIQVFLISGSVVFETAPKLFLYKYLHSLSLFEILMYFVGRF